jgi:putative ABC transport system substrate-binding protein
VVSGKKTISPSSIRDHRQYYSAARALGAGMRRRDFIGLAGWAAVVCPFAVKAQQANKVYRIGTISAGVRLNSSELQDSLSELGWIEGKNLIYERRYAENRLERLPDLVAELIRLNVDVIVANGTLAPIAAKRATTTIPIVMTTAGDPLGSGLVASLAKPGGNVTGLSLMAPELAGKRLELLREVIPGLARIAVLWNAANPYSANVFDQTKLAAEKLGMEVQSLAIRTPMIWMVRSKMRFGKTQLRKLQSKILSPMTIDDRS